MPKSTGTIENGPQNRGARSEDRTEEPLRELDTNKVELLRLLYGSVWASSDGGLGTLADEPWQELPALYTAEHDPFRTFTGSRKSSALKRGKVK